ncbi:MAG TPA: hypothetical protein PLL30_05670 [Candidatus Krumholzibacteria bacterium]|nr:hypothetical protein [Candidatus Krumholzibacteria bacterium]HPD71251.1 hypothetical protein [Candidatus Krumholzibacteria bacterium]HRY39049.1 hypothetical protein [Candidatus Krumholzibacteria bacterium]
MHLQWLSPWWVWPLLVAAAAGCVLYARSVYAVTVPRPPDRARRWLVALRAAACLLVIVAVARPLVIRLRHVSEPAVVAVVVEDSGSLALRDGDDGPSRWSRAWDVAAGIDSLLAADPGGPRLVALRGNGRGSVAVTSLAEARADTPRAVGSDLPSLVAQAQQRLLGRPLRGLVALSDGHSEATTGLSLASDLPLWLVGVGDVAGPADRYLADLRYPDRVHRGEPLTVEVTVGERWQAGGEPSAAPVTVRLLKDGAAVAEVAGAAAEVRRWELTWKPEQTGLAVLEVEVSALDNERFLGNNRATLAVDVQKDRARVLVLAPVPGWDVRFLAQAASREPRLALTVVRPGPAGPVLADSLVGWTAPAAAADWRKAWEGVVLAGPPGAWLPDGGRELAAAVGQGLGLCVLAGDPATDENPRAWPPALREVIPVVLGDVPPRAGEYPVEAAADAPNHPVLAGITHGPGAAGTLAGLPPLRRLHAGRTRPEARTLLVAGADQPLLVASGGSPGRVLWFGGRRLWELAFWQLPARLSPIEHPGRQLLRQMLLWTALGDQAGGVALLGQRLVYEEGEPLPVAVRWRDLRGEPVTGRPLAVEVARPDSGEARLHLLAPDPGRPGVATADLPPLPPGRWRLTPRGGEDLERPVETGPPRDIVVTRSERELAQVRQDRRNLRQTAERLGGTALDAGRPDDLARLGAELAALDLEPVRTERQDRHEPASGWPWLLAAVGLLAAEWLLRRRHGLL